MKKFLIALGVTSSLFFVACNNQSEEAKKVEKINGPSLIEGVSVPTPLGSVNDFENILSQEEESELQESIESFKDSSGNELILVTLDTIPKAMNAVTFASAIGNEWGVGDAEKNNGLILFLSQSKREVGIATGKGIETIYTDSVCNVIIGKMIPHFSLDNYADGLQVAITELKGIKQN